VDKAVEKGIIPEALKGGQLAAFEKDFEGEKTKFEKLFDDLEENTEDTPKANEQLGDFITKLPKSSAKLSKTDEAKTYAWYQENDPEGLAKLQANNPKEFEKLLDEHLK
jgi:septal ring factor EnvC (AmiA/AmiB activator)